MRFSKTVYSDFAPESYFRCVDDFIEMQQRCQSPQHHCGHYSTFLRDFAVFTADGKPSPHDVLGPHPLGVWPAVQPLYSARCPVVINFFTTVNSVFRDYLRKYHLKILGISFSVRQCENGKNYFLAVTLGNKHSPDLICKNCTQDDCRGTHRIDLYARSLHARHH